MKISVGRVEGNCKKEWKKRLTDSGLFALLVICFGV